AFLGKIRRGEVYGDASVRALEVRRIERSAHAVARLADLFFRKADNVRARKPATRVDLDAHEGRIEAGEGAAVDDGERHALINSPRSDLVDLGRGQFNVSAICIGSHLIERSDRLGGALPV